MEQMRGDVANLSTPLRGRRTVASIAVVCALLSAACWGVGIVAAKGALDEGVAPMSLVVMQLIASLALLVPATLLRASRIHWPTPASARRAALSGVLEYGATYTLAAFGLALTTAGNAALIGAAEPALIVLAAALYLRERSGARLLILLGLVTVGLIFVVLPDLVTIGMPRFGDLLLLGSATTGAIYAVLSRRFVLRIAPLPLSLLQQAAGLCAIVAGWLAAMIAGWTQSGSLHVGGSSVGLGLAILSGVLQHAAAVWLHLHALKRMPASMLAIFLALVPVFALVTARLFLHETITSGQLVGGAFITCAIVFASATAHRSRVVQPE